MSSDKNAADDDVGDDVGDDAAKESCCVDTKDMEGESCHVDMLMVVNNNGGDLDSHVTSAGFSRHQTTDFCGSPSSKAESQSPISRRDQHTPDTHATVSSSEVSHRQAISTPCDMEGKCPMSDCRSTSSNAEMSGFPDITVDEAIHSSLLSPSPSNVLWKLHSFVATLGESASSWLTADPGNRVTTDKFSDSSKTMTAGTFHGLNIPHHFDKRLCSGMYSSAKGTNVRRCPSPCENARRCLAAHSPNCFTPRNTVIDRPCTAAHTLSLESLKNCFPVQEQPLDLSLRRNYTTDVSKTADVAPGSSLLCKQNPAPQTCLPFLPNPEKTMNRNLNPARPTHVFKFPPSHVNSGSSIKHASGRSNNCHAKSAETNPRRPSAVLPSQGKRHLSSHYKLPFGSSGNRVRREVKDSRPPLVYGDPPITRKQWSSRKPWSPAKPLSPGHRGHAQYKCNCGASFETLYQQAVHMEATGHCPSRKGPSETETFEYQKLVRGQDLWLNYGSEQAREILRCMRCQRSFASLSELTLHMIQTKHYEEIVGSSTNSILTDTTRKKQQNLVASDEALPPVSQRRLAVNGKSKAWRVDRICNEKKKQKDREAKEQKATCASKPVDPKEAALDDGKQGETTESAVYTAIIAISNKPELTDSVLKKDEKHKAFERQEKEEKDSLDLHLTSKSNDTAIVKVADDATLKVTEDATLKVTDDATLKVTEDVTMKVTDDATLKVNDDDTLMVTDDIDATLKVIEDPPFSDVNTSGVIEIRYGSSNCELTTLNTNFNDNIIDQNEILSKAVAKAAVKKSDDSSDDSRSYTAVSPKQTLCVKRKVDNSNAVELMSTELDEFKAPAPKMSKRSVVLDTESSPIWSNGNQKPMSDVSKKSTQSFNFSPTSSPSPGRNSQCASPAAIPRVRCRGQRRFSCYDSKYSAEMKYPSSLCRSPESMPNRFAAESRSETSASALDAMQDFIAKSFSANATDLSGSESVEFKAAAKADRETRVSPNSVSCTDRASFTRWTYGACNVRGKESYQRIDSGYSRAEQLVDKSSALKGNNKHKFKLELDSERNPKFVFNDGVVKSDKEKSRTKICQETVLANSNDSRSSTSESDNQMKNVSVMLSLQESELINSAAQLSEIKEAEKIRNFPEPLQTEFISKDDDSFKAFEDDSQSSDRLLSSSVPPMVGSMSSENSQETPAPKQNPCKPHKQDEKKTNENCMNFFCECRGKHDASSPSSVNSQHRNKCLSSGSERERPESVKPQNKRKITRSSETSSHESRENLRPRPFHNRDQSSRIKDLIKTSPYIYLPLDHSAIFNKYSLPWTTKEPRTLIQSRSRNPSQSGSHTNFESEALQTQSPKSESPNERQTTSGPNSTNEK